MIRHASLLALSLASIACGATPPATTAVAPSPPPSAAAPSAAAPTPAPPPPLEDPGEAWAVTHDLGPGFDWPADVAVAPSGVYVAGARGVGGPWVIQRRALADGAPIWEVEAPATHWGPRALAIVDGSLWVAGDDRVEKRALSDGSLVRGFGDGGALRVPDHVIHDVVATADDLFLIGESHRPGEGLWVERRSAGDGAPRTEFGDGGAVRASGGPRSNFWLAGALLGSTLYVAGFQSTSDSGRVDALDARRGSPVTGFGDGGTLTVGALPGGVVDVAGVGDRLHLLGVIDGRWLVERRDLDGHADASERFDVGSLWDAPRGESLAAAIAADARGVVAGGSRRNTAWVLRDVDEGAAHHYVRDPTPARDELTGVALDDRFVYALGFETVDGQDTRWRLERIARGSDEAPPAPAAAASAARPAGTRSARDACEARGPHCRWVADHPCRGRGARCLEEQVRLDDLPFTCHCDELDPSGTPVLPQ